MSKLFELIALHVLESLFLYCVAYYRAMLHAFRLLGSCFSVTADVEVKVGCRLDSLYLRDWT